MLRNGKAHIARHGARQENARQENWAIPRWESEGKVLVLLMSWKQTQTPTGEATKPFAAVKTASEGLGIQSVAKDLGTTCRLNLHLDASATLSLVNRRGLGKAKHVDMETLWIQGASKSNRFATKKIGTNVNPADLITKPLTKQTIEHFMSIIGYDEFLQSVDFRKRSNSRSMAIRRCMTRLCVMRRTRSSDVCQLTKPTQVLLQIEAFNASRARARGEVLTDSTKTGTVHDFCDFLVSLPAHCGAQFVCALSVTRD